MRLTPNLEIHKVEQKAFTLSVIFPENWASLLACKSRSIQIKWDKKIKENQNQNLKFEATGKMKKKKKKSYAN